MRAMLFVVLATACGPKLDPLAPMAAELQRSHARQAKGTPHARFAIASTTTNQVLQDFATFDKPLVLPLMMGTAARVTPTLKRPDLTTRSERRCHCQRLDLSLRGMVDVSVSSLFGSAVLADDLGFTAELGGAPQFRFRPQPDGTTALTLSPRKDVHWTVDITLDSDEGMLTNKLVDTQIEPMITDFLKKDQVLFRIPAGFPIRPVGLRLEDSSDPAGALWLAAPDAPDPAPVSVDQGWGLSTTDKAITDIARAFLVDHQTHPRWKIEPLLITPDTDRFTATIRIHRVARRVQYRDYKLTGRIEQNKEEIRVTTDKATLINKKGWEGSLIAPFVNGQVRKRIVGRELVVPREFSQLIKDRTLIWRVGQLTRTSGGVLLTGSVRRGPDVVPSDSDTADAE